MISVALAVYDVLVNYEYDQFCGNQALNGKRIPSRDEYWKAKSCAYCIENPPAYPWWKSTLAAILTKLFKL